MWSAEMAVSQNTGVPWIMCQQFDAPKSVVKVSVTTKISLTSKGSEENKGEKEKNFLLRR